MSSDLSAGERADAADSGDPLAERVAAAVRAVPGVHDLHAGVADELANRVTSRLPGHRVTGVHLADEECTVRVVLDRSAPVAATAGAVHRAVGPLVGRPVHLVVEDLADADVRTGTRTGATS